jgi:Winged helix-turn helix
MIRLEFGVSYHPAHVSRVCQALRWSPQKPARRACQRHAAAITHWRDETWSTIKKGHKRRSKRSSLETKRAFIPCPVWCARMPR